MRAKLHINRLPLAVAGTLVFANLCVAQTAPAGMPLLASCDDTNEVKATIQRSDPVKVRFSMVGSGQECYSVSVSLERGVVDGYVLGSAHPDIAEFERVRSRQPAILPYVPPPPPPPEAAKAEAPPPTPQPVSLAGFRAMDLRGRALDLDRLPAKTIVVYFWSPSDRRGVKDAEMLDYVYEQYQPHSVEIVGVANGASTKAVKEFCDKNEAVWPQVLDSGKLAQQYHVDRSKPYIVLDQQRNVVATLASASQLDTILRQRTAGR